MDEYVTIKEAVEVTKISRATLYRMVEQGKLTIYKVGGGKKTYLKREELQNLFAPGEYKLPKENPVLV